MTTQTGIGIASMKNSIFLFVSEADFNLSFLSDDDIFPEIDQNEEMKEAVKEDSIHVSGAHDVVPEEEPVENNGNSREQENLRGEGVVR